MLMQFVFGTKQSNLAGRNVLLTSSRILSRTYSLLTVAVNSSGGKLSSQKPSLERGELTAAQNHKLEEREQKE